MDTCFRRNDTNVTVIPVKTGILGGSHSPKDLLDRILDGLKNVTWGIGHSVVTNGDRQAGIGVGPGYRSARAWMEDRAGIKTRGTERISRIFHSA